MRFFQKFILIISCLVVFQNCAFENKDNSHIQYDYTLKEVGQKTFPLDSVTSASSATNSRIAFYKQGNENYLLLFNFITNDLYWYRYDNARLIKKQHFEIEGPNGVGNLQGLSGFYVKSPDSIFICNNQLGQLSLVDSKSRVLKRYNVVKKSLFKNPVLTEFFAPACYENKFVLNTWGVSNFYDKSIQYKSDLFTVLNLENSDLSYSISYPKKYSEAIWGMQLHFMYSTFNYKSKDLISSFVIDDTITVWNLNKNSVSRIYAGASFINKMKPLTTDPVLTKFPDVEVEVKNQLLQDTYGAIYSDPYTGYCFRFVNEALTDTEYNNRNPQRKLDTYTTMIVLDESFKKIGEFRHLSYNFRTDKIFFTEAGLHILDLAKNNEDEMNFQILKVEKK